MAYIYECPHGPGCMCGMGQQFKVKDDKEELMALTAADKRAAICKAVEEHSNKTLKQEPIKYVQEELADNLGIPQAGLPWYGIGKVANYSAQISAALAWGINPEILRYSGVVTDEEIEKAYEKLADLNIIPTEV
jgi:hypothetical protein